jgi:hypothetical protein
VEGAADGNEVGAIVEGVDGNEVGAPDGDKIGSIVEGVADVDEMVDGKIVGKRDGALLDETAMEGEKEGEVDGEAVG